MYTQPFASLQSISPDLSIVFFEKGDTPLDDDIVRRHLHASHSASLWQVHGAKAVVIREPTSRTIKADAFATDIPGLALTIRIADCQSFIVYEPVKRVVGLIHAGWHGLLEGIIPSFFDVLFEEWQIRPEETFVGAAPSLCLSCSNFTDPERELPTIRPEFFSGTLVNLRAIAEDQLFNLGVAEDRFERMEGCTACNPRRFWTYRGGDKDAVRKGMTNILACVLHPLV